VLRGCVAEVCGASDRLATRDRLRTFGSAEHAEEPVAQLQVVARDVLAQRLSIFRVKGDEAWQRVRLGPAIVDPRKPLAEVHVTHAAGQDRRASRARVM
jgi:hypothetical protein